MTSLKEHVYMDHPFLKDYASNRLTSFCIMFMVCVKNVVILTGVPFGSGMTGVISSTVSGYSYN